MEAEVQFNLRIPESLKKKIKEIAAREGSEMTTILVKQLEEYVKVHGEGNPIYPITKWIDEEDFKMTPAFFESLVSKWRPYMDKCNKLELDEIRQRAEGILEITKQRLRML